MTRSTIQSHVIYLETAQRHDPAITDVVSFDAVRTSGPLTLGWAVFGYADNSTMRVPVIVRDSKYILTPSDWQGAFNSKTDLSDGDDFRSIGSWLSALGHQQARDGKH